MSDDGERPNTWDIEGRPPVPERLWPADTSRQLAAPASEKLHVEIARRQDAAVIGRITPRDDAPSHAAPSTEGEVVALKPRNRPGKTGSMAFVK